jgi:Holliday junction resolvasome RuvABC endonuclease subunit
VSITKKLLPKASRVMGIDGSTNSFAFCILEDGEPIKFGEVTFQGADIYHRLLDAKRKIRALTQEFDIDYIALEKAVMVKSADVAIKLGYIFGAMLGELLETGAVVAEVYPIQWQAFIGNGNFTAAEKIALRKEFPNKSATWYAAKTRDIRKHRTMDFFNKKFKLKIESDNVSDAFGVAWYATHKMVQQ